MTNELRLITAMTLTCGLLVVLALIVASPFLIAAWLIPKLFIHLADKANVASCYTYTWRQFLHHRGSIIITRSKYGWWGHVMWVDKNGDVLEYRDLKAGAAYRYWKRFGMPPLWFEGEIVKVGEFKRKRKSRA